MIEILKIIILTCQISGSNPFVVEKTQKECQKELMKCVDSLKTSDVGGSWGTDRIVYCLKER